MKQREAVLKSFKHLLGIYDRKLEDIRQEPISLNARIQAEKKISQVIVSGVKAIKKNLQEDTHFE